MFKFLSDDWFKMVAEHNEQAGNLNLPPALQTAIFNAKVTGEPEILLYLKEGKIYQGQNSNAASTVLCDNDTLQKLISSKNTDVALEAFMTGKIRIEGDMSALMSLQSARPSAEQKQLYKAILAQTDFS